MNKIIIITPRKNIHVVSGRFLRRLVPGSHAEEAAPTCSASSSWPWRLTSLASAPSRRRAPVRAAMVVLGSCTPQGGRRPCHLTRAHRVEQDRSRPLSKRRASVQPPSGDHRNERGSVVGARLGAGRRSMQTLDADAAQCSAAAPARGSRAPASRAKPTGQFPAWTAATAAARPAARLAGSPRPLRRPGTRAARP